MESTPSRGHHHQRPRSARGPRPPHLHARQPPTPRTRTRRKPSTSSSPASAHLPMEDGAISTLMDVDESPLNGAGFLDEDDGEGELFVGPSRAGVAMDLRGPLPFADFFNSFDGADFDDADLE